MRREGNLIAAESANHVEAIGKNQLAAMQRDALLRPVDFAVLAERDVGAGVFLQDDEFGMAKIESLKVPGNFSIAGHGEAQIVGRMYAVGNDRVGIIDALNGVRSWRRVLLRGRGILRSRRGMPKGAKSDTHAYT